MWYRRKALELHSSLKSYLFMQIAVNFKSHKNPGVFQLRKDAFGGVAGVADAVHPCSQAVVQLLETLTGCVRYLCSVQELSLHSIRSLPSSVLWVVKSTFTHCKVGLCWSCAPWLLGNTLEDLILKWYCCQSIILLILVVRLFSECTQCTSTKMIFQLSAQQIWTCWWEAQTGLFPSFA